MTCSGTAQPGDLTLYAEADLARRIGRVERVVAAGRRLADGRDPVGAEARRRLPATTGLSSEGVELALGEYLETNPTRAELESLARAVGSAPACHVVLSANVCVAALRALALAVATAELVVVRPSRRDPVVAELLVDLLSHDAHFAALGGSIARVADVSPRSGDELHVYGADATIAALRAQTAPGVRLRGHGSGLGLAVVGERAELTEAASALARDVVVFDQRGCLSPRVALVEGGSGRAEAFAAALDEALTSWDARVQRGAVAAQTETEIALYRSAMEAVGVVHCGRRHAVGVDPSPRALVLPPAARVVHVVAAEAPDASRLVAPWAGLIAALGADVDQGPLLRAVAAIVPRARRSRLGRMQTPPFDGPVDRRAG